MLLLGAQPTGIKITFETARKTMPEFLNIIDLKLQLKSVPEDDSLHILEYPNKKLFEPAKRIEYSEQHYKAALRMFALFYKTKDCAALAASQLSFKEPLAITVIDFSPDKDSPLCLINPVLSEHEGETYENEGCMSIFPKDVQAKVKRAAKIRVQALDLNGNKLDFIADGFMAKCIQHETDHLNGQLYIQKLGSVSRKRINDKIKKAKGRNR